MKPVWVVDDDASIRWVLEKALGRAHLPVRLFESANDAMRALQDDTPQVLVSDIRMPGDSGALGEGKGPTAGPACDHHDWVQ